MDETKAADPDDPYRRLNYRRLIAWSDRIAREWPFLETALAGAPQTSVVDLGCGTGEHCRFLASKGFRALGVDRSKEQIAKAREYEGESGDAGPSFHEGDIAELPLRTDDRYGAAICLGNVLPHFEDGPLEDVLGAVKRTLLPGGRWVVQLLNYQRILDQGIRHLPINFRPDPEREGGEIVWLRVMTKVDEGHVLFHPTTLRLDAGGDPAMEVHASREVLLRAWTWDELKERLIRAGFGDFELYGDMARTPFDPAESSDLIFVAVADR